MDAARRKSLGASVRKYEDFRQKTVQRFDQMYSAQANNHTAGRNQAIAHLLSCLSLMRSLGDIPHPQPILTWSKAQVFAVTGTVDANAAHCLPCQLWIDNQKPWELLRSPLIDRRALTTMLQVEIFGHETILPIAFNIADSLSENNCLRGALLAASAYVIEHTKPRGRQAGVLKRSGDGTILLRLAERPAAVNAGVDHHAVLDAYRVWQRAALDAYHAAAIEAGEGVTRNGTDLTDDVLYILERYRQAMTDVPPRAKDHWIHQFENDLWV